MIHVAPFRALRPPRNKAHLVASRSYVSYSRADLHRKLSENPFTFIHIINPEFGESRKTKPNSPERFMKVKARMESFIAEGNFIQDDTPHFYIYQQATPEKTFTGLVCGVSVRDYREGRVKIHEHTLTEREEVFCRYLDVCNFNAEPVLLTYNEPLPLLEDFIDEATKRDPHYDFTTTDRNRHRLWCIPADERGSNIQLALRTLSKLYIADGHHRMASSARLSAMRNAGTDSDFASAVHDFVLSLIIPASELLILPFHRVVTMQDPIAQDVLLRHLRAHFKVDPVPTAYTPTDQGHFGLRLGTIWWKLQYMHQAEQKDLSASLDANILHRVVLEPFFGIVNPKSDSRLSYIPGNEDIASATRHLEKDACAALFTLAAVPSASLFAIADAGEVMPPKSTWIAPKLRSGLTVMLLG